MLGAENDARPLSDNEFGSLGVDGVDRVSMPPISLPADITRKTSEGADRVDDFTYLFSK